VTGFSAITKRYNITPVYIWNMDEKNYQMGDLQHGKIIAGATEVSRFERMAKKTVCSLLKRLHHWRISKGW
jgi:hypothetical protein